jgi:hypothetical protein
VSDQLGRTPLHISSLFDNEEAAKLLVAYGADIDSIDAVSSVALLCAIHLVELELVLVVAANSLFPFGFYRADRSRSLRRIEKILMNDGGDMS